jgi:hypothetical protein
MDQEDPEKRIAELERKLGGIAPPVAAMPFRLES